VNVKDGEVEITDPDLKRAQLVKVTMETVAVAMTVVLYLQMILDDATIERLKRRFVKWRNQAFGPPPMTEEQIQEAAHQVNIEAARILRSANES
jgi:hypothetical protein